MVITYSLRNNLVRVYYISPSASDLVVFVSNQQAMVLTLKWRL